MGQRESKKAEDKGTVFICLAMNPHQPTDIIRLSSMANLFTSAFVFSGGKGAASPGQSFSFVHIDMDFGEKRFFGRGSELRTLVDNMKLTNRKVVLCFDWYWFDINAGFGISKDTTVERKSIYGNKWFSKDGIMDDIFDTLDFDIFIMPLDSQGLISRKLDTIIAKHKDGPKVPLVRQSVPKELHPLYFAGQNSGIDEVVKADQTYIKKYLDQQNPFCAVMKKETFHSQWAGFLSSMKLILNPDKKRKIDDISPDPITSE